jgi:hypothetical protein
MNFCPGSKNSIIGIMSLLQSFIDKNWVNASFHEIQQSSVTNEHLLRSIAKKNRIIIIIISRRQS